ncbi:MAG: nuclear transport factor 2 family protein [Pseudobutyrivibrio sp.]|uniref:Nuclear transport factor 2 family protein n=1 Tax=Pseudobutyrivibrio xylanivorans TaxID=185007 RepID=A0A6M0LKS9_PSEXY|nr:MULTISPECIES: hypothetical protein [Pseudobutyrivibrio]MBE5904787.1 nuclear transport factor 2 family protein [Pseudobutyrivibrio sp.]NEX02770.1 nuclear transport factor 2 family protein [Pseudobutyrivibrio xylanivorans]SCY35748.1 hypothetical protein SAMN05660668_02332 [Pseudobutyrivibrio sp. AR14]SFR80973.1 hypothetical protein SAMN04487829_2237 [Pseudobutyrivibrio sp. NOR37]
MDIKLFWNDIITQNRGSLSSYFCKDAVIRWHCTNEQFTVEEYVQANCDYPGRWQGEIERIEEFDSQVIFVGRVQSEDAKISCHVTSFIKMKNDKIVEMDEYWSDDGEAPVWRRELGIGKAIR